MAFNQKDIRAKEKQDRLLKVQLEKEREQQLISEIEKTEKERIKKKGLKTLKQSGVLDSYQYLLTSLCKYGLPTGDLYEFSALQVLRYEKKLKSQKKKELDDRLKKREEQKKNAHLQLLEEVKEDEKQRALQKGGNKKKFATNSRPPIIPDYDGIRLSEDQ